MENFKMPIEIERYEKKIYDLKQLLEISKGLNSTLNITQLIESILLTIIGHHHVFNTGIFLNRDIEDPHYYLDENYKGFDIPEKYRSYMISTDSALIKEVFGKSHCLTKTAVLANHHLREHHDFFNNVGMELLIPLNSRERVAGIIMLGQKANEEDYTEEEKGFLLTLSSIAAVAVENARLYELATVDLKTRLKIHHYFQTRLREEIERAKRLKIPLSLLITDIDHFKKFNDKYGHQTGDFVLKNVASVLLANIRTYDIAARFGGEEFTVILPNTPIKKAQTIGNRIRREIEKSVFISEQGELKVTISVGVAQLDPDNENGNNDLIEKADKALYQAKDAGRNRTIVYENDNGSKI